MEDRGNGAPLPTTQGHPDGISRAATQIDPAQRRLTLPPTGRYPLRGLPAPSCLATAEGRQPRRARLPHPRRDGRARAGDRAL